MVFLVESWNHQFFRLQPYNFLSFVIELKQIIFRTFLPIKCVFIENIIKHMFLWFILVKVGLRETANMSLSGGWTLRLICFKKSWRELLQLCEDVLYSWGGYGFTSLLLDFLKELAEIKGGLLVIAEGIEIWQAVLVFSS